MNVLTVGALAHGEGIGPEFAEDVHVRPITRAFEPSPFSRVGPGIGGATKPDLVDIGGTMVFDPMVGRLRLGEDLASAGVLTLHHRPLDRLRNPERFGHRFRSDLGHPFRNDFGRVIRSDLGRGSETTSATLRR